MKSTEASWNKNPREDLFISITKIQDKQNLTWLRNKRLTHSSLQQGTMEIWGLQSIYMDMGKHVTETTNDK